MSKQTQMQKEAMESPRMVTRQLLENQIVWEAVCHELKSLECPCAMTIARGSSDHAATYAKYLFETAMGVPTVSAAPSILTLYKGKLRLENALVVALSQSGQSPDIVDTLKAATDAGAVTVAIVNQVNSPLADAAKYVVPQWAGDETSVAATKSYITTLTALAQFVAIGKRNKALSDALDLLPERLKDAMQTDWSVVQKYLKEASDALVVGRGYGYPIAQEAALKLKETSALHAEAFSSAEVLHGPFALVKENYPMLLMTQNDASYEGAIELSRHIVSLGAKSLLAAPIDKQPEAADCTEYLALPESLHPMLDPIMAIQAFYMMASDLAVARGYNPDKPDNLKKVTETR